MIEKRIAELFSIQYEKRLLIFDTSGFCAAFDYTRLLISQNFEVIRYEDIEAFQSNGTGQSNYFCHLNYRLYFNEWDNYLVNGDASVCHYFFILIIKRNT
jgi:hypothetical protein